MTEMWDCPCGQANSPAHDFCQECALYRGKTGHYKIFGFWRNIDADIRFMLHRGDDPETEINCMMNASKGAIEAIKEIVGDEARGALHLTGPIYTLQCKLKHVKAIAKLREVCYLEGARPMRPCDSPPDISSIVCS